MQQVVGKMCFNRVNILRDLGRELYDFKNRKT